MIISMLIMFVYVSRTLASEQNNQESIAHYHTALILSDNSSDSRKKLAYLVTDATGKPSIYPSPIRNSKTGKDNDLCGLSINEITQLWGSVKSEEKGSCHFEFAGGYTAKWSTFKVDLKFDRDDRCDSFKVVGPGITNSDWLPTKEVQKLSSRWTGLPPWVGCVEMPFDVSRCGIDIP
jgi:hypothetical protein